MKNFRINQKIELVSDDGKTISTTIHDRQGDRVYISVTASDLTKRILRPGEDVNGILYCDNKLLAFTGTISDRIAGDISLYEVSNIANLSKAQRRKSVRASCTIDMRYSYNKYLMGLDYRKEETKGIIDKMDRYLKDGIILDISAGGAGICLRESLEVGSEILLFFTLKEDLIQKARIIYKDINMTTRKTTYFYGVKFIDIDEREREQIMSYVFLLMRKNRIK